MILAEGVLNWHPHERQTDRYGAVHIWQGDADGTYATFDDAPVGQRGCLIAEVIGVRPKAHVGDFFRGVGPSTPTVGERVLLGNGTLFIEGPEPQWKTVPIGVRPGGDAEYPWLDVEALYRVHNQRVRLIFEPLP